MPLSSAQQAALQGLMDRGYRSMSGYITPILNALENLTTANFDDYVTYLPAYNISGVASSSTASVGDQHEVPSLLLYHSGKTNKKELTYLKSGASGAIFRNSGGDSKNIAITSGNIWKLVTINSAEDIRDMFMEAFALAILGADDDPLISGSICRILGFYRPTHVRKTYGASSESNYGYQLIIKMSPYQTIDQHIEKVGQTFENYRIIINKTSNLLYKLRDKYSFIHCDLHVGNVMFKADGSPVLIDFGRVGLTIGSTRYATSEYAQMGFSFDMLLYVMSLYCDVRRFHEDFRQILMYKGKDLFKFFLKNPTFTSPYEWYGPYNFYLGEIAKAPNVLYASDEIQGDGKRIPRPTEKEMTDNIISINKASKTTWECIGNLCRPVTKFFSRSRKNRSNRRNKTRRFRKHRRS